MPESLIKKLKTTTRLPSPPGTALEILRLSQKEDVSIGELADTIAADPALSVRLLKYANSAMVGMAKEVTSVRKAVLILGLRSVRLMALSFSLVSPRDGRACPEFDYGQFWSHSLARAVSGRYLTKYNSPVSSEEAFAAGLLTHIGKLVFAVGLPEQYATILSQAGGALGDTQQKEIETFGMAYPELGAALLTEWGIPDRLASAIRFQSRADDPDIPEEQRPFATLLAHATQVANLVCMEDHEYAKLCAPKHQDEASGNPDNADEGRDDETENQGDESDAQDAVHRWFTPLAERGIFDTIDQAQEAVNTIREEFKELASILSLNHVTMDNAEELQAQAGEVLGELSLAAQFKSDAVEKENLGLQLKAFTDALTGISNRAAFDKRLSEAWGNAVAKRRPIGLVMLDVDHFKKFNDTFGHRTGDEVLKGVARCLQPCVRSVDFVARYGGEEFAVILPNVDRLTTAQICVKMRKAIEDRTVEFGGAQHHVTVSLGAVILVLPGPTHTPQMLIEMADQLLYKSKAKGRNCCSMKQIQPPGRMAVMA